MGYVFMIKPVVLDFILTDFHFKHLCVLIAWPRLTAFATRFKVAAGAAWVQTMVQSKAYRKLLIAWETGQPITPVLIRSLGPDFEKVVKSQGASLLKMKY